MNPPAGAPQLHSTLGRAAQRIAIAGVIAAFLSVALTGLIPERLQIIFVCSCIALALVCVAGLLYLAGDPGLRWGGMSPAVAMALGVIAGGLPGFLTYRAAHSEGPGVRRPVTATTQHRARGETPATMAIVVSPPAGASSLAARPAARPLPAVLAEIATILNQRARPVLESLYASLTAAAGYDSIDPGISSQLDSSAGALADVEASLERIEADHPDLATELRSVMGDSRALAGLNSSLRQLSDSQLAARGSGTGQLRRLASTVHATLQWVDTLDQRIASAQQAGAVQ